MAEGFLKGLFGGEMMAEGAGCSPSGYVHPIAIEVMAELGIEIGTWRSKSHAEFLEQEMQTVITVCGSADQCCPTFRRTLSRVSFRRA
ncbi:MAG: arsenate reductase [Akkermansiaceae bacterium]|jgi:arsenate reductase